MTLRLVASFSRFLLPLAFSLGAVAGCADDAPPPPPLEDARAPSTPNAGKTKAAPKPPGTSSAQTPEPAPEPRADGAPTLSSISPDAITVGTTPLGLDLVLTGTRFAAGAQVDLAGTLLPATVLAPTRLSVHVPVGQTIASGVLRIAVIAKPGVKSNPLTLTVANPASVSITELTPDVVTIGESGDIRLALSGTGFVPSSVVKFNGSSLTTAFTSATSLSATIPGGALLDAGRHGVTVSSGTDTVSLPIGFEVRNPVPRATAMAPSSATSGDPAVSVTIDGDGFTFASQVLASGSPLATSFVSAKRLRATIPAGLLVVARTLAIVVQSPGPGGGAAAAQSFTVEAAAGSSSGDGAGGGAASCLYACADYGYTPGLCSQDWYCIASGDSAGCLTPSVCD